MPNPTLTTMYTLNDGEVAKSNPFVAALQRAKAIDWEISAASALGPIWSHARALKIGMRVDRLKQAYCIHWIKPNGAGRCPPTIWRAHKQIALA